MIRRLMFLGGVAVVWVAQTRAQLPNPFHKKAPSAPSAPGAPPPKKGPVVPDVILRNGHIYTANPMALWVEAVAIVGDHVSAVGTDAKITPLADKHTQVIDLQGKMAMPGINDAHESVGGVPFGVEAKTKRGAQADPPLGEVMDSVRIAVSDAGPGAWIHAQVGPAVMRGVKDARNEIDAAGGSHPVMLEDWRGGGAIVNGEGLKKLGIDDKTPDPVGGRYERDASGHLTGKLEGYAAYGVEQRLGSEGDAAAAGKALAAAAAGLLGEGVTTVQLAAAGERLSVLGKSVVDAKLPLRVRIVRFPIPAEDAAAGERMSTAEEVLSPTVRVYGVEWVLDGPGGRVNFTPEFVREQLEQALTSKNQLLLQIGSEATTDAVLDAMEKLGPGDKWRPQRVRFEGGAALTTPARVARAKALGIVIADPAAGSPWRSWAVAAIPVAYGSGEGMGPFAWYAAMSKAGDAKSLTRLEALDALTRGPAYAEVEDQHKGWLAPGNLADVTVLSQDITTVPAEKLPETKSVMTMVGGKVVFGTGMGGS